MSAILPQRRWGACGLRDGIIPGAKSALLFATPNTLHSSTQLLCRHHVWKLHQRCRQFHPLPRGLRMALATHPRVHAEGRWCPPRIFIEASCDPISRPRGTYSRALLLIATAHGRSSLLPGCYSNPEFVDEPTTEPTTDAHNQKSHARAGSAGKLRRRVF